MLTALERSVLAATVADEPALLAQLAGLRVAGRELTGVGMFVDFAHPEDDTAAPGAATRVLSGPHVDVPGSAHGLGFLVYVDSGLIACLEGHTYGGESWPECVDELEL